MLQRGLLTNAEQQQQHNHQQHQMPYDTSRATAATYEINLLKEQENLSNMKRSSNRENSNEEFKERIHCLPIIEMPQIKIEQDDEEYMEGIEEAEEEQPHLELETKRDGIKELAVREQRENMEVIEEQMSLKPVPQLIEPTSILKTSLLTGAANTLATLTAAAEQIARMPNESLTKQYQHYFKEENKRSYVVEQEEKKLEREQSKEESREEKSKTKTTTTYTSILQTALMSKRPATLNVAATSSTLTTSFATQSVNNKTLHVRTPDQVLKTAVTLATLGEIAAQQEQQQQQLQQMQQQQQQQQNLQQQQQQQTHILVVPQVQPSLRKMCTLPFKKLNFANVTTSLSSSTSLLASNNATLTTSSTSPSLATCLTNTASSNTTTTTSTSPLTLAATTTTITNNFLGSNIKSNLNNATCILNTNNQAASNLNRETSTSATFFDTKNLINNVTICSNSNNSKTQNMNMQQTLKIPTIKPQLVTTQTQTEETSSQIQATTTASSNPLVKVSSSLQTAVDKGLLRTAVSANTKLLTQNSLNTTSTSTSTSSSSSSPTTSKKFQNLKSKILNAENMAKFSSTPLATNVVADFKVGGNIIRHASQTNSSSALAKLNVIQNKSSSSGSSQNSSATGVTETQLSSSSSSPATNVTVVVFETLLPED